MATFVWEPFLQKSARDDLNLGVKLNVCSNCCLYNQIYLSQYVQQSLLL